MLNSKNVVFDFKLVNTKESINKFNYINTIDLKTSINNISNNLTMHLYKKGLNNLQHGEIKHLCNSLFKPMYASNFSDILDSHSASIVENSFDDIIGFIKDNIDPSIKGISLVEENGVNKFKVNSSKFDKAQDLTSYGDGLQRIFEIALAFAYCKDGVLLIDEFETAIHKSLLLKFTKFMQVLADKFNVQLFLTSHSKEAIDAFVNNGYKNEDISAYLLDRNSEKGYKYIKGDRLKYLIDSIDLDLRGDDNE
jgi:AAA15 family ATPase/GTPase